MRSRPLAIVILAAATLAGCAAVPPSVERRNESPWPRGTATGSPGAAAPAPARAGAASVPAESARSPAAAANAATSPLPGSGGYYLDDGPHPTPPADLDRIPEPEPRLEPLHRFANNPYSIFGESYTPERILRRSLSRGVASWYGRRFHGNRTANGEIYDMYQLTAAHPTLPIPSYARVTNLANGRSLVVRVNDRGPFIKGRAIDLSYAAAARLGYIDQGHTEVEIESIDPGEMVSRAPESREPPASRAPSAPLPRAAAAAEPISQPAPIVATAAGNLPVVEEQAGVFLQLGAFQSPVNAESVLARLIFQLEDFERNLRIVLRNGLHRIWVGPFRSRSDALAAAARYGVLR